MRLHRFFIDEPLRNKKEISLYDDEIIHQWKDVFRLRGGDKVILLDNSGFEYLSEIKILAKGQADVSIIEGTQSENIPNKNIWLFAALIKKDNYEWILEKGTEIGVSDFVPVVSDRTEKKDLNIERAEKIIKEASEQSGRGIMPVLHTVSNLEPAFALAQAENVKLIAFHLDGESFSQETIKKIKIDSENIGILIGPEGGWSDKEINLFKEKNIPIYTLGKQVLRAETAAIVIPSLFLF